MGKWRPPSGRVSAETAVHLVVMALCFAMIVTAIALEPQSGGLSLAGRSLPELCSFKRVTGIPCPGCGLSRSWVAALRGDLGASIAFHPLGWLVLLYAGAQFLRHGLWLSMCQLRNRLDRAGRWLDYAVIPLAILLFAGWSRILL